jgi:hypothetical protein
MRRASLMRRARRPSVTLTTQLCWLDDTQFGRALGGPQAKSGRRASACGSCGRAHLGAHAAVRGDSDRRSQDIAEKQNARGGCLRALLWIMTKFMPPARHLVKFWSQECP